MREYEHWLDIARDFSWTDEKPVPKICDPDELADYARSPDSRLRYAVARNKYTSPCVLTLLALDPEWTVRMATAWNPFTPEEAIIGLSKDAERPVRDAAMSNKTFRNVAIKRDSGKRAVSAK